MRSSAAFFFFNDTATTEIYTLSLHDALPIYRRAGTDVGRLRRAGAGRARVHRAAAALRVDRPRRGTGTRGTDPGAGRGVPGAVGGERGGGQPDHRRAAGLRAAGTATGDRATDHRPATGERTAVRRTGRRRRLGRAVRRVLLAVPDRSEERRVGKECRSRW